MNNHRNARNEKIIDLLSQHLDDVHANIFLDMQKSLDLNCEVIKKNIQFALENGLKKLSFSSVENDQIGFISISFLQSSFYTSSNDFCISYLGADGYKSELSIKSYFSLSELFNKDGDFETVKKILSNQISGLRNYEIVDFTKPLYSYRLSILPLLLYQLLRKLNLSDFSDVLMDEVPLLYGGYMDKSLVLGNFFKGCWKDEIFSSQTR